MLIGRIVDRIFVVVILFHLSICLAQTTTGIDKYRRDIWERYEKAQFSELEQMIISWKNTEGKQNRYDEVFLALWHAKIKFCLGYIDSAVVLNDNLKALTKDDNGKAFNEILFHPPLKRDIKDCIIDHCICQIGKFKRSTQIIDNLDMLTPKNISKYFLDIKIFVNRNNSTTDNFDSLYYRIKQARQVFLKKPNNEVKTQLFLVEKPKSPIEYSGNKKYDLDHALENRMKILNERGSTSLIFDSTFQVPNSNDIVYTTGVYDNIPRQINHTKFTNKTKVEGFVMVDNSRYYFKATKSNKIEKIPIIWDDEHWELQEIVDRKKIHLKIVDNYHESLEINFNDEGWNILEYIGKGVIVDSDLEGVSIEKFPMLKERNIKTKDIKIPVSALEKEKIQKEIKLRINEKSSEAKKSLNRSKFILTTAIVLNIIVLSL